MKTNLGSIKNFNYLGLYEELIRAFLNNGYKTKFFSDSIEPKHDLILRHDIDFDCDYAHNIAAIESNLAVNSTYFFLLSSDSYNLLSSRNIEKVLQIKEMGNKISLHFDPVVYGKDYLEGFRFEREVFEKTFKTEIKIISIHRPNDFFLNFNEKLDDVEHTYQRKYFKDIKYISDSQGLFRFEHPLKSEDFRQGNSIHLLTHPIWWQGKGRTNIRVLQNHIEKQKVFLNFHVGENCKPFKEYLSKK